MTPLTHEEFCRQHPGLDTVFRLNPTMHTYTILREDDSVINKWEQREDGLWYDITAKAKAAEKLKQAERELKRTQRRLSNADAFTLTPRDSCNS